MADRKQWQLHHLHSASFRQFIRSPDGYSIHFAPNPVRYMLHLHGQTRVLFLSGMESAGQRAVLAEHVLMVYILNKLYDFLSASSLLDMHFEGNVAIKLNRIQTESSFTVHQVESYTPPKQNSPAHL